MSMFFQFLGVFAIGAAFGVGSVYTVQTHIIGIPEHPHTAEWRQLVDECKVKLEVLMKTPGCAQDADLPANDWLKDFTAVTPVQPNAMPKLRY